MHLGGYYGTGQNAATDADEPGKGAFFVCRNEHVSIPPKTKFPSFLPRGLLLHDPDFLTL